MSEVPYSKREMDNIIKEIHSTVKRIEEQTTKTNGRVSKLETWRGFITGGLAVVAVLLVPILFMLIKQ